MFEIMLMFFNYSLVSERIKWKCSLGQSWGIFLSSSCSQSALAWVKFSACVCVRKCVCVQVCVNRQTGQRLVVKHEWLWLLSSAPHMRSIYGVYACVCQWHVSACRNQMWRIVQLFRNVWNDCITLYLQWQIYVISM